METMNETGQCNPLKVVKRARHLLDSFSSLDKAISFPGLSKIDADFEAQKKRLHSQTHEGLVERLVECVTELKKIQQIFDSPHYRLMPGDYGTEDSGQYPIRSWKEEREMLMKRRSEPRHHQLSQVGAVLLDIIASEAGLVEIDRLLCPDRYELDVPKDTDIEE